MLKKDLYSLSIQNDIFGFYAQNTIACDQAYADANDDSLMNLYTPINEEKEINTLLAKTSIILLTANKYERNILHKRIRSLTNQSITQFKINLLTACEKYNEAYAYSFEWNNNLFLHIHANVTGSYTIGGSADIIRWIRANDYLFPKLVISFGICFGTDSKNYKIGDVILSDKIYPYFIGAKINKDKNSGKENLTVVDDNAFRISGKMDNRIKNLKNNNLFNQLPFQVDLKSYITGEAVVSSQRARETFDEVTTQKTPVGEMEGYGVFKECNCPDFRIPCLVLKSICDWGIEKNFNIEDEDIIQNFKVIYNKSNKLINDEMAKNLINTLKDRLQAYSSDCAFTTLATMVQTCTENVSLFKELRAWMLHYNGAVITCKEIIEKMNELAKKNNIRCKSVERFVHRSIMTLAEENVSKQIDFNPICKVDYNRCHGNKDQPTIYKSQPEDITQ